MTSELAKRAALNNAAWCDVMARAHGKSGIYTPSAWFSFEAMPRFYPNLVTLDPAADSSIQIDHIRSLMGANLPEGWAIKDSFACLDLQPLGFRRLLDANWAHLATARRPFGAAIQDISWRRIEAPEHLRSWEAAWAGDPDNIASQLFPPPLLSEPSVHIIAGYRDQTIVAGCIASEAVGMVGITNLFLPSTNVSACRQNCIASVMKLLPGMPLISYGADEECEAMQDIGFELIGPLRIMRSSAA